MNSLAQIMLLALDLAWWLVGRGDGAALVSSTGELPRIEKWR